MLKILFICSANRYRSRTAHEMFENKENLEVKSCGLQPFYVEDTIKHHWNKARHFTKELFDWADIVYVMEEYHLSLLKSRFNIDFNKKPKIINLNIEDIYGYNDPLLKEQLKEKVKI